MSTSLWPNFAGLAPPRGMIEMLYDAAGDIGQQTNGAIDFYVDPVGVGVSGAIKDIRYNCYLRVVKNSWLMSGNWWRPAGGGHGGSPYLLKSRLFPQRRAAGAAGSHQEADMSHVLLTQFNQVFIDNFA